MEKTCTVCGHRLLDSPPSLLALDADVLCYGCWGWSLECLLRFSAVSTYQVTRDGLRELAEYDQLRTPIARPL